MIYILRYEKLIESSKGDYTLRIYIYIYIQRERERESERER